MNASTDRLLRRTLWGNAAFSVVSGAVLAAFAGPFAKIAAHGPVAVLGLDLAIVLELLGLGVMAFGALCAPGLRHVKRCRVGLGPRHLRRRHRLGGRAASWCWHCRRRGPWPASPASSSWR